jgi:hypothetical protein
MNPEPNSVRWAPDVERNGPSVTELACRIVGSKARSNCHEVNPTAFVILIGIVNVEATSSSSAEPTEIVGTAPIVGDVKPKTNPKKRALANLRFTIISSSK